MSLANRTAGFRRLVSENFGIRGSKVIIRVYFEDLMLCSMFSRPDVDSSFLCMQNLAAWAVAGTAAYILWVKPEKAEQQKRVSAGEHGPVTRQVCSR